MACFPRFFQHKTKNSFTPAQDANDDTLFNDSVQIGQYIRREDTPTFTPKNSNLITQVNGLKIQQKHNNIPNGLSKSKSSSALHDNNNDNNNNISSSNKSNHSFSNDYQDTKTVSNGDLGNKFKANRNNSNSNSVSGKATSFKRNQNAIQNTSFSKKQNTNSNQASPQQSFQKHGSSKLKPVRERRPTALPFEIIRLDSESLDENGERIPTPDVCDEVDFSLNGSYPHTPSTPTRITAAEFFIGNGHADDDCGSYRSLYLDKPTNGQEYEPNFEQQSNHSSAKISTSTPTDTKTMPKYSCTTNLKQQQQRKTHARQSSKASQKQESENVNIPTPPPIPPQPLTTASSTTSLASIRSANAKRHTNANKNTQVNIIKEGATTSTIRELDQQEPQQQQPEEQQNNHSSSTNHDAAVEVIDAKLDKVHNNDTSIEKLQATTTITITKVKDQEAVIEIETERETKTKSKSKTKKESVIGKAATIINSIAAIRINDSCDVSVVEDGNSLPNGKDITGTPKSHRMQGGLIFSRPNVPIKKDIEIPFIRKDERTRDLIRNAIEKNDFLHNYMDKERKEMVIDAMSSAFYDKDAYIIRENDEGSEIYVSEEGYFDVMKDGKLIGTFGPETVFGELAILYNAKRFASVKAASYARVWKIERETFRRIMVISGSKEREENLNFLRSAPFLNDLGEDVLDKIVDLLQRKFYETNTCIVREGDIGNEFFIIRGGTVTIKKKSDEGIERVVARRKRGEYFGEQALLNADCRQASVYADAPGTEVLKLDRETFISYLGTIPQLREKPVDHSDVNEAESVRRSEFTNEYANIELTDLKQIATLGAGAFGRVDLVSYGEKTFALKIIKKIDVVKQDQVEHVYNEKHVMMKCRRSPFIIQLYKTYRNEKYVYFLMEACMGGDVWTVMSQRRFFDEKTARFIAGCVVEAFDFLHSHNIIYRDLKPENLMLTTDGYCKLVDFGFAKQIPVNQKTNTFAGTPEYVAPEIILDRGHDRSVDYWALGILIFELLVGRTPFRGQNQIKIYQQILGGIDVIQMPSKLPKSAQHLIKHLCKQLPAERLGYQRRGILDIKKHSWFDSLDWNKLKNKQLSSPIKRPIKNNTDLQHFGPSGVEHDHDPPDELSGWDIDF